MNEKTLAEKQKIVEELKEKISRAKLMLISDYTGLTVAELSILRRKLRAEDSEYRVIKNTLIARAAAESGFPEFKEYLNGSTALLLGYRDAVAPLRVLTKFFKEIEKGKVRVGAVEKKVFGQKELEEIAKLPSREVLLGQVLGGLQAPISGLVNVLNGPIRKLVYALNAVKEKKQ